MNRRKFLKLFGGAAVAIPAAAVGLAEAPLLREGILSRYETPGFRHAGTVTGRWTSSGEQYGRGPAMSATEVMHRQNEHIKLIAHEFEKAQMDLAIYGTGVVYVQRTITGKWALRHVPLKDIIESSAA